MDVDMSGWTEEQKAVERLRHEARMAELRARYGASSRRSANQWRTAGIAGSRETQSRQPGRKRRKARNPRRFARWNGQPLLSARTLHKLAARMATHGRARPPRKSMWMSKTRKLMLVRLLARAAQGGRGLAGG